MTSELLAGTVAIVTGATSGIGEASAYALARAGARVLVTGRRTDRGAAVVEKIQTIGGQGKFFQADMRSAADIICMVEAAESALGRVDFAFNNAGLFDQSEQFHAYEDAAWDDMISVNLSAVFRCMRAEIAAMLRNGGGVIVNNASTVGHRGSNRASPAYVAAKHGVIGLTRSAALEYARAGIRVNAVLPGTVHTPMLEAFAGSVEGVRALAAPSPTGRPGTPEEVAEAAVWLSTDAARFVNGHCLAVDGGVLAS